MKEFSYVINDSMGLHARPAGMLARKASEFQSMITISNGKKSVDAKSIFGIMQLAVNSNQKVIITIDGKDEEQALLEIEQFLKGYM